MNAKQSIRDLHRKINNCHRCLLYKTAIHAVPGEGNPDAKIMFVGEAPGKFEDQTGRPFVGRAGKLLGQLFNSIGLKRKSVFITSVVKHRTPKNRQPKASEINACGFWLENQLKIIQPKLIVTLGRFGLEYFLSKTKISQIHGKIQKIGGFWIFPVYHPSAGLRSTRNKQKLTDDFQKLKKIIEKSV